MLALVLLKKVSVVVVQTVEVEEVWVILVAIGKTTAIQVVEVEDALAMVEVEVLSMVQVEVLAKLEVEILAMVEVTVLVILEVDVPATVLAMVEEAVEVEDMGVIIIS